MRRLVALALAAAGCGIGSGKGSLAGTLYVQECSATTSFGDGGVAAYNMNPSFFVAEPTDDLQRSNPMNRVAIRVQSSGNRVEKADVMFVNVASVGLLAQSLGQPVAVGPATNLRASLILNRTCPAHQVEMELDGQLAFGKLGSASAGAVPANFRISYGDELAASFSFDVVDRRAIALGGQGSVAAAPSVSGHLDGNFDFVVRQSTIAQTHP